LPALLTVGVSSGLQLDGGTRNTQAPPINFLEKALLPLLNSDGAEAFSDEAISQTRRYLAEVVPLGASLADELPVPIR